MIPNGWGTFFAFLLFIAPGIVYDLQRLKKQAHYSESNFREMSRVVLISTICSITAGAATLTLLSAIRASDITAPLAKRLPSPQDLVDGSSGDLAEIIPGASFVIAFFMGLSLGMAWLIEYKQRSGASGAIKMESAWTATFRRDQPKGSHPIVRIKLYSGTSWSGKVAHFSPDLDMADREIVLASPIEMKTPEGKIYHLDSWPRVVLPAIQIESISVRYEPENPST